MPVGGRTKFEAKPAEMLRLLRIAREFDHLRGDHLRAIKTAADPRLWNDDQRRCYEAALPELLLRERRLITSEDALGRNGLFFPNAIFRRVAFLFGAMCVACNAIGEGLRMLPLVREVPNPKQNGNRAQNWPSLDDENGLFLRRLTFDNLRRPFCATLGDTVEPLCLRCRHSFAAWVIRYAGPTSRDDEIEIAATAWLSGKVSTQAKMVLADARRVVRHDRRRNSSGGAAPAVAGRDFALPAVRL